MKLKTLLLAAATPLLLNACSVYKIDVQQGNEITAAMLAKLEIGMSKAEVGETIGLPLVNDPFHIDRWDYYFYLKHGASGDIARHSATLLFRADRLHRIDSALPAERKPADDEH